MNYQRIYDQIIDRAGKGERGKGQGTYYESHHIVPRCMGGSGKKSNLILLTAREHFICHWLLVRIYPDDVKLAYALWGMCNQKSPRQSDRHTPSSRAYSEAKECFAVKQSEDRRGFYQTKQGKKVLANRTKKTDYIARTANTDYGKIDYEKRKANTDWEARSLKKSKSIVQYSKEGILIREWKSILEAAKTLGISDSIISACCKGKKGYKSAGGFLWKYKTEKTQSSIPVSSRDNEKPVLQFTKEGVLIKEWNSIAQAAKALSLHGSTIGSCCKNKRGCKSAGGFIWKYK